MDTEKKIAMLAEIDELYKAAAKEDEKVKVQDVVRANLDDMASKYGVDPVDIFVMYMDHVAITSKKIGQSNGDEKQIMIDFNDLDNLTL